MTDLKRERIEGLTAGHNPEIRWQVSGPAGAIVLHCVADYYAGLAVHRRGTADPDLAACDVIGGEPCEVDALSDELGRRLYAMRATESAVFLRLEAEYRRAWPGGGQCGESVPQAGLDSPKAGA